MSDALFRHRVFRELKHRNVYRVVVAFVAGVVFKPKIEEGWERLKRLLGQ